MDDDTIADDLKQGDAADVGGSPEDAPLPVEQLGDYRLVRLIARGGMGEVYEGIQEALDRRVAVKILTSKYAADPIFLQRFEREAKAAAALNHPNVVQVYDFGQVEGRYYLVMEYIEGEDMAQYLARVGKLKLSEALEVVEQVVDALKTAQERSIIHRDIKPANLMRTRDGRIKVSDLGLAKNLSEDVEVTMTGMGVGSPHFLAPEQADDARHADHRADIYSLGITFLYFLTGKFPFDGNSAFAIVVGHANKPLPTGHDLGTDLPDDVEHLIQTMAAKSPDDRYPDYETLQWEVRRLKSLVESGAFASWLTGGTQTQILPPGSRGGSKGVYHRGSSILMPHGRGSWQLWAGIAAVLVVIGLLAVVLLRWGSGEPGGQTVAGGEAPPSQPPAAAANEASEGLRPSAGRLVQPLRAGGTIEVVNGTAPWPLRPPNHAFRNQQVSGETAEDLLAKGDEVAKANPQSYAEIIHYYRMAADFASDPGTRTEAARKFDEISLLYEVDAMALLDDLRKQMREHLSRGDTNAAIGVWQGIPDGMRSRELGLEVYRVLTNEMPDIEFRFGPEGPPTGRPPAPPPGRGPGPGGGFP